MAAPLSASYVYALVAGAKPRLGKAPTLPGAGKPRLLDAGQRLHALVATVPLELYDEAAIERGLQDLEWVSRCAVGHERVLEYFSKATALVPLKLFTLFHSDERALAHVAKGRKKIDAVVARVSGCVELGVRVALAPRRTLSATLAAPASGTAFLARKKRQKDETRELAARASADAEALHAQLAARADEAAKRPPLPAGPRLLLDAAYLVPRKKLVSFKEAVAREARALEADGLEVTLTGPWPPYNFAVVP